ncbi:MAG: hypothetical protein Q8920_07550 [Bacillota bacterium]|nr:hypothetical protein [Bacillota bacterium]
MKNSLCRLFVQIRITEIAGITARSTCFRDNLICVCAYIIPQKRMHTGRKQIDI